MIEKNFTYMMSCHPRHYDKEIKGFWVSVENKNPEKIKPEEFRDGVIVRQEKESQIIIFDRSDICPNKKTYVVVWWDDGERKLPLAFMDLGKLKAGPLHINLNCKGVFSFAEVRDLSPMSTGASWIGDQ